ncbi:hypothetical protein ACNHKD_14935 [Methylocystis sp. JAN1]|uniref:hypothetical protein n=1 Tax=Methylocystis sp. JAN1 TaxID=3397211 RepID=UPI003FA27EEF
MLPQNDPAAHRKRGPRRRLVRPSITVADLEGLVTRVVADVYAETNDGDHAPGFSIVTRTEAPRVAPSSSR